MVSDTVVLGSGGTLFLLMGLYLVRSPDRFSYWLYHDKYDSEARESWERGEEYVRGILFILAGIAFFVLSYLAYT